MQEMQHQHEDQYVKLNKPLKQDNLASCSPSRTGNQDGRRWWLTVDDIPAIRDHSLQLQMLHAGIIVDLVKTKTSGQVTGSW